MNQWILANSAKKSAALENISERNVFLWIFFPSLVYFYFDEYSNKLGLSFQDLCWGSMIELPSNELTGIPVISVIWKYALWKPVIKCSLEICVALLTQESNQIASCCVIFFKGDNGRNIKIMRKYAMCIVWKYTQSYLKYPLCKMEHQSNS